uniref:Uncharacterized protein n=1 Tax=Romanomermis culicivorax TaxID=13658 RepID=A0A915IPS3_ROMCU
MMPKMTGDISMVPSYPPIEGTPAPLAHFAAQGPPPRIPMDSVLEHILTQSHLNLFENISENLEKAATTSKSYCDKKAKHTEIARNDLMFWSVLRKISFMVQSTFSVATGLLPSPPPLVHQPLPIFRSGINAQEWYTAWTNTLGYQNDISLFADEFNIKQLV